MFFTGVPGTGIGSMSSISGLVLRELSEMLEGLENRGGVSMSESLLAMVRCVVAAISRTS